MTQTSEIQNALNYYLSIPMYKDPTIVFETVDWKLSPQEVFEQVKNHISQAQQKHPELELKEVAVPFDGLKIIADAFKARGTSIPEQAFVAYYIDDIPLAVEGLLKTSHNTVFLTFVKRTVDGQAGEAK